MDRPHHIPGSRLIDVLMACGFVVLLSVVGCDFRLNNGPPAEGGGLENPANDLPPLILSASIPKAEFFPGEPVPLTFTLRNVSSKTIVVCRRAGGVIHIDEFRIDDKRISRKVEYLTDMDLQGLLLRWIEALVALEPGQAIDFDPFNLYPLEEDGSAVGDARLGSLDGATYLIPYYYDARTPGTYTLHYVK